MCLNENCCISIYQKILLQVFHQCNDLENVQHQIKCVVNISSIKKLKFNHCHNKLLSKLLLVVFILFVVLVPLSMSTRGSTLIRHNSDSLDTSSIAADVLNEP